MAFHIICHMLDEFGGEFAERVMFHADMIVVERLLNAFPFLFEDEREHHGVVHGYGLEWVDD